MHHLTSKLAPTHSLLSIFSHFRSNPNHQTMSGFSYYNGQSPDAPSLHNSSFVQVSSTLQREMINTECFQGVPFHFQSAEVNAACSIVETEVPLPGIVCGLNKRNEDDLNADTGVTVTTQMPKKRMKSSSKVALRKNEEKKTKASKIENEGQSPGTPEIGYVHVRARRGQATDSHSLAERVRREKIGERMKLLQSLVPGCDKIAGKTQVLDEIINYVQSLQTQLQILAGKLSILSPYARDYENSLEGIAPSATTTEGSIRRLDASLSCMMESSCNLLHFHDDTQHNSIVSSSSPSLTSQGDQKYSLSQDTEVLLRENDVQGLHISSIDQYWLDHFAQLK